MVRQLGRPNGVESKSQPRNGTLGEIITAYRRRLRQPYRDLPWSQEELAFASGTDQAHISRIESNRQHPEYSTLGRICDALALSQTERSYLLALAGYQVVPPLPDDAAIRGALRKLAPLLDSFAYPATLIDEGERMWYSNELAVTLWGECYGSSCQERCLELIRGRRSLETIFEPAHYRERIAAWAAYYEDLEHVLLRNVALFWRAFRVRANDPEMKAALSRLSQNPDFCQLWDRVSHGENDLLYVDHATYTIHHPELGQLRLHCWRTRAAIDERFIVVHFSPVDAVTSRILTSLTESPARRGRASAQDLN
jgi:transcriptional regulator with XRE-family HTH domain